MNLTKTLKRYIPRQLFQTLQPTYHSLLTTYGAVRYRFPSKKLYVVGVTGTKGKSTVTELIAAILEEAGHTTALSNTIRFKVADETEPNLFKMSMPGRTFMQHFLARAVQEDCAFAVIEMTSEGAKLNRHQHIALDALVFTNLSPNISRAMDRSRRTAMPSFAFGTRSSHHRNRRRSSSRIRMTRTATFSPTYLSP
jgi:AcrR family transcriptional regulator